MTYLEKVKQLLPNILPGITDHLCPWWLGLEKTSPCESYTCEECWNREIQNKIEEEEKL